MKITLEIIIFIIEKKKVVLEKLFFLYVLRSNVIVTNYFITFLHIIDVANYYLFSFESTTNILFLLTNNHSQHY